MAHSSAKMYKVERRELGASLLPGYPTGASQSFYHSQYSASCTATGFAMNKGCFKDDLSCFGVRFGWQATVLMSPSLAFYFGDKQLGSFHTEGIHRLGDRGKGRVEQRHPRVIVETADRDFARYR